MTKPDAIQILVQHQAAALIRHGASPETAEVEAQQMVDMILADLERMGLQDVYVGVALRRARVYRLRCQGVKFQVVCERLGITRQQAARDYRQELMRRRTG